MSARLSGKVCIVTGTGGSMGRAAALAFALDVGRDVSSFHLWNDEGWERLSDQGVDRDDLLRDPDVALHGKFRPTRGCNSRVLRARW
jgi:hypothetical protein